MIIIANSTSGGISIEGGSREEEEEEEGEGEEEEEGGMSSEWRRYSSPEMLKGEIKEGNEKSVVIVLGMIIKEILNKDIPFNDADSVSAGELIVFSFPWLTTNIPSTSRTAACGKPNTLIFHVCSFPFQNGI
jgi:hypothetical protein